MPGAHCSKVGRCRSKSAGSKVGASGLPVATASAVQVRRPINRDGIGRWLRYADRLEPLQAALYGEA